MSLTVQGDFDARFREATDRIGEAAQTARSGLDQQMAALIQMQSAEIARLQGILLDATSIPERHAVSLSVASSVADSRGAARHFLCALASDKSLWRMDYMALGDLRWRRLPQLPQPADEMSQ